MGFSNTGKRKAEKMSITSLMDALTIILIFLLTNYSDVVEDEVMPEFISLPKLVGVVDGKTEFGVLVVLGDKKIQVGKSGEEKFINFNDFKSEEETVLEQFKNELKVHREKYLGRQVASVTGADAPVVKMTIQADKELNYEIVDKILSAAGDIGMNHFTFITLKVEEGLENE